MILILLVEVLLPRNHSFEKNNRHCLLIENEMSKVHTRKMKIELGLEMSSPNNIMRCHSNKVIHSILHLPAIIIF